MGDESDRTEAGAVNTVMNLHALDATMKDVYPLPGTRMKQWVVDMRREDAWERETCPVLDVPQHSEDCDDAEAASGELRDCASVGRTSWLDIHGRECRFCEGFAFGALGRPEMVAWFAAKKARPPICADRDQLSDEIAPDMGEMSNPMLAFLRGSR